MRSRITGTKAESKLYEQIDQINMPSYERLVAKAHLAQAEVIADLIAAAIRKVKALAHAVRELAAWPTHRAS